MFDISVILINYFSSEYTLNCIKSIEKNTDKSINYNIVVVDNNSAAEDYNKLLILEDNPKVRLIRSNLNLGFAGGNMLGTQFTKAKYYFFLNNDCLLQDDCLSELMSFCEQNPNTGLCSPQMLNEHGTPEKTFGYFPTLSTKLLGVGLLRLLNPSKYPDRKKAYTQPLKVDVITGSSMFIRSQFFNEVGGLDTNFFLYCEEEDIAIRMHKAGYDTYLVPSAHNIHYGGMSTSRSYEIEKEFNISFLYLYRKHYGILRSQVLKLIQFSRLVRKFYKDIKYLKLAFFVLAGAPNSNSLRHKQKMY